MNTVLIKNIRDQIIKNQSLGIEDALKNLFDNGTIYGKEIKRYEFLARGIYFLQLEK